MLSGSLPNKFSVPCGLDTFRRGGGGGAPPWTPSPPPPPAQASPWGYPLPPNARALTLPQRHSHTPTPAPTASPTASNRPHPLLQSPVTALSLLGNCPHNPPPFQSNAYRPHAPVPAPAPAAAPPLPRLSATFLETPIQDVQLASKPVHTVHTDTPTFAALLRMREAEATALGLVAGPMGTLVGNVSSSDLRGFTASDLPYLSLPVDQFLKYRRRARSSAQAVPAMMPPVVCAPQSTLRRVLELMQVWMAGVSVTVSNCQ